MSSSPTLSVIIPCRNEAESLPVLLHQLAQQRNIQLDVIVADGESQDNSAAIARDANARLVCLPPHRGKQMNAGAQIAQANWLLFLHADSQLTHPQQLSRALQTMQSQQGDLCAGHFPLQFIDRPPKQRRWRVLEFKTTTQLPLTISGDQGLLIQRDAFSALGRFPETYPFLEDQMLAHNIHQHGRWVLLPHALQTSARRFVSDGFWARYGLMTLIMIAYCCGLPQFLQPQRQYPEQARSRRVRWPQHALRLLKLSFRQKPRNLLRFYWQLADLGRSNLYQVFLWLDTALWLRHFPLTRLWLNSGQRWLSWPLLRPLVTAALLLPGLALAISTLLGLSLFQAAMSVKIHAPSKHS